MRRYLRAQGRHRLARPKRATEGALAACDCLEQLEVRSFEVEHVAPLLRELLAEYAATGVPLAYLSSAEDPTSIPTESNP